MQPIPIERSRYELLAKIASGGMGTVYIGRQRGAAGFSRLVAIKRAHPHLLEDNTFARMLVKEAALAGVVRHPNAVSVLDVEELDGELLLIMEYVEGVPLAKLITATDPDAAELPPASAVRIVLDACAGLHACHTATDEAGAPLSLVHRDVSPQNVLVGVDGQARLTDFGIAKSLEHDDKLTTTGVVRGKTGYMAPEYAASGTVRQQSDVFSMGVVLWEALCQRRLFRGATELETLRMVTEKDAPRVSEIRPGLGDAIDDVVAAALARDPTKRFASAEALASALEEAARSLGLVARHRDVAALVSAHFGGELTARRQRLRDHEIDAPMTAELPSSRPSVDDRPTDIDDDVPPDQASTLQASSLARLETQNRARRRWPLVVAGALVVIGGVIAWTSLRSRDEVGPLAPEPSPVPAPSASSPPSAAAEPPTPVPTAIPSASAPPPQPAPRAKPIASSVPKPPKPKCPKGSSPYCQDI